MEFFLDLNIFFKIIIFLLVTLVLFRLCYFFEGFSTFKFPTLLGIFVFLLIAVIMFFGALIQTHFVIRIKENYALAEGKITYYHSGRGRGQTGKVEFNYVADDELISNSFTENSFVEIPETKPDTTISYLVIYEDSLPENSYLLFNYPIKDSDDMLEYEELFKKGIPEDVFVN
ncbi:hypothetical protein AR687_11970 [Flavobacteriaceae bacterium CRH]|nr:hypothetical protein AR687_11970 [Flavobacteriaceae bacterium CRH]